MRPPVMFRVADDDVSAVTDLQTKRGQRKSRNGCSTCKKKRRKCDETKPGCLRCRFHNVACGGYDQGIRWRPVKIPNVMAKQTNNTQTSGSQMSSASQIQPSLPLNSTGNTNAVDKNTSLEDTNSASPRSRFASGYESHAWDASAIAACLGISVATTHPIEPGPSVDMTTEYVFDDLNLEDFAEAAFDDACFDANAFSGLSLNRSPMSADPGRVVSGIPEDDGSHSHDRPPDDSNVASIPIRTLDSRNSEPPSPHLSKRRPDYQEDLLEPSLTAPVALETMASEVSTQPHPHALPNDSSDMIKRLSDLHTGPYLSFGDDPTTNPWRAILWPLSYSYAPLYHALAAMTCFHNSSRASDLQSLGLRHLECATQALATSVNTYGETVTLEAGIATRVALLLLRSWDSQSLAMALPYTTEIKALMQRAVARQRSSQMTASESHTLRFLASTWVYTDVMYRFGCSTTTGSTDDEFIAAFKLASASPPKQNIESLMGCANTLFLVLSRLADLVHQTRRTNGTGNLLHQISKATELRAALELWDPTIDANGLQEDRSLIVDVIQTAEAYRWAGLLLVRQAVPEIPWAQSQSEIAHKTLVYLATIPPDSPTAVTHTFPLLVASVEATQQDNREWIRAKWEHMSTKVRMPNAARFKELMEEVWRRRDEFERHHGFSSSVGAEQRISTARGRSSQDDQSTAISNALPERLANAKERHRTLSVSFPDSLAFKRDIDPVTRAGCSEYTVRGSLHFLNIMKEWEWDIMLA